MHTSRTAYVFRVGNHWINRNKIQGKPKQVRPEALLMAKYFSNLGYIVAPSCLVSHSGQHTLSSVSGRERDHLTQLPT